jgi:acetyl-CoA/propionyl-CoA carboxylase
MFRKVLVSNRGEIALRIIRTLKVLGIRSVAIYSDADRESLHVRVADESYRVGSSPPSESYLNQKEIVSISVRSGADAIHPGYGFLAENSEFAALCEAQGVKFIGPSAETLSRTGNKSRCRQIASSAGVPVPPGSREPIADVEDALSLAEEIGYPLLLKSAYGGGGIGIREVWNRRELQYGWSRALSEAKNAFGRSELYVEKMIRPARHIEVQVLSDGKGSFIHLGERECSIQRRHQKLIELTPSPVVDDRDRRRLAEYAISVAKAVGYRNAGTVEFLRDEEGGFYFIEVNSRLQVEHPITEEVTGVDIVQEQLRIASGEGLSISQSDVVSNGAAIECRITAEDPLMDFAPDSGKVTELRFPGGKGIRVDSALYTGCTVPEFYDSLVAKVIARGKSLDESRRRISVALDEFHIAGVKTSIPFLKEVLDCKEFQSWRLSTNFIEECKILERLRKKAEAQRSENVRLGAAIAASLLYRGVHKVVAFDSGKGVARRYEFKVGRGRYFDTY